MFCILRSKNSRVNSKMARPQRGPRFTVRWSVSCCRKTSDEGSNATLSARTSSQANECAPKGKSEFNSTWLHLKLEGAATPSNHKTCGLGIRFDSHRPLHN